MKVCDSCSYVEHWGAQEQLVCPNCEESLMHVFFRKESACTNDSYMSYKTLPRDLYDNRTNGSAL